METISALQQEIAAISEKLKQKENELEKLKSHVTQPHKKGIENGNDSSINYGLQMGDKLPKWAIERYSRQILLPNIGVLGQEKLCAAKVLIVGAGGLGCPAAMYLAGAGVAEIGIVDYDTVDVTNLHRQVLHTESRQDLRKTESAAVGIRRLNSNVKVTQYNTLLSSSNALDTITGYDVALDCTDNVPTRYLLNDACVLAKIPLISGSALQMEGQLTIYNYSDKNRQNGTERYSGPCYRCLFPAPPPADTVGSCSASGVAGPIPGTMGTLQALEAIKYIVGYSHDKLLVGRMLIFDGDDMTFRTVKLRPRNPNCAICSETPTITKLIDYEMFCKAKAQEKDLDLQILPPKNRITATQLADKLNKVADEDQRHLLLDVRSESEYNMCRIDGAVNCPLQGLHSETLDSLLAQIRECAQHVTFICRRGNDSQIAAKRVIDALGDEHSDKVTDLTGGLHAWADDVHKEFPKY